MGRHQNIRHLVVAHLAKHAGKPVTANEIMTATGLSLTQVQAQMRMIIADGQPVTVVSRAQVWVFNPEPEAAPEDETAPGDPTGEIFEGIGRTRSGAIIVRDGNGVLFVLREMDL